MPTLREIRLYCKRHQTVMFCAYVAAIYIILNVFVAESNVSLLRFKKSDNFNFDDLLNENDVEDLRGRGITISGGRSNKRNNINDLHFVKKMYNGNEDLLNNGVRGDKVDDFVDEFYQGDDRVEGEEDNYDTANALEAGNLPKNKFHEERNDGDFNYDELKREMLRGKLERFKKLDDIVKEEKREFGAYWEKVNKNKEKKNEDTRGDGIDDDKDNVHNNDGDDKSDKKDEADKEDYLGNFDVDRNDDVNNEIIDDQLDEKEIDDIKIDEIDVKNDEENENTKDDDDEGGEIIDEDENKSDEDKESFDDKDDKREDENEEENERKDMGPDEHKISNGEDAIDPQDSKRRENDIENSKMKVDDNDTNDSKRKENDNDIENSKRKGDDTDTLKSKSGRGNAKTKHKNETKNVEDNVDVSEKDNMAENPEHNAVLETVMDQLKNDKLETFEIDLVAINKTVEDTKLPHFVEYGKEGDPGQNSTGYFFPALPDAMQKLKDKDYTKNYFDLWVSDKIAVHRSLNDPRTEGCRKYPYNITTYPTISIIIVFHNEAWTTLLRSVHSIIDRTPPSALLEIILVDDFSDDDDLKEPLEVYMKTLKLVRVIRATNRLGLIKARNMGFLYAKGDILVFLDSHIECFDGWLEPLIGPIIRDPKTVTFPIIDVINRDSFKIDILPPNNVGSIYFAGLTFVWERSEQKDLWYYRSPTMPGGLYAISRKWFHHLGAYDPGLQLWGGENLEISFKIWMCGGTLLASACSHVAHVFRATSPNKGRDLAKVIKTNTIRLAEVWLDKYKHLYYEKINYKVDDFGNVTNQKALRKSLHCKSFDWYLTEIDPKLKKRIDPGGTYSGLITNRGTGMCLMSDIRLVTVRKCDVMNFGQVWQLSPNGFLSNREYDLIVMSFASRHKNTNVTTTMYTVKTQPSNREGLESKALFSYDQDTMHLIHQTSKLCLDVEPSGSRAIRLSPCHPKAPIQKWELMTREELQAYHRKKKQVPIDWSV